MHVFALGSSPSVGGPPVGDLVTWSGVVRGGFRPSPRRVARGLGHQARGRPRAPPGGSGASIAWAGR